MFPLIVFYNLNKKDYKKGKIEKIEEGVKRLIWEIPDLGLDPEEVSFSFPYDPSVTSNDVPVFAIVKVLSETKKRTNEVLTAFAAGISNEFTTIPGNEDRKMGGVVIEGFGSRQHIIVPVPKPWEVKNAER